MSERFIRIAVIWFGIGVLLGAYMGISHQRLDRQIHVHALLLGWVSCALFALAHRAWPAMQKLRVAAAHFWLHNAGLLLLVIGLAFEPRYSDLAGPFLGLATGTLVMAVGLFSWCIYRSTSPAFAQTASDPGAIGSRLRSGA